MTANRANAYAAVMTILRDVGGVKLLTHEQERIRNAADELVLAADPDKGLLSRLAIDDVIDLVDDLVEAERWLPESAEMLVTLVAACGGVDVRAYRDAWSPSLYPGLATSA
jgi:hypothetical protein